MKTFMKIVMIAVLAFTTIIPAAYAAAPAKTPAPVIAAQLIKAQLEDNHFYYTLKGEIDVTNVTFKKQVAVYWDAEHVGGRIDANYKMPLDKGHELWVFQTNINKADIGATGITFNVRYKANGKTFIDNNNANDYALNPDMNTMVLGNRNVALENAAFDWTDNAVNGTVVIRPGYPVQVKIEYTTDHWVTKKIAFAVYKETLGDANNAKNLERWAFRIPVDEKVKNVEFAVALKVNNKAYWDNNNLMNYRVER